MNTFGRILQVTTFGESHGEAVGSVVDGCPANLELSEADIQKQLDRRRPGQSDVTTSRGEADEVEILSGVFDGKTLGTPISLLVRNSDTDSSKYLEVVDKPRPGHADYAWRKKFAHVDWRGGGRSSARETVGRVAASAIAGKLLRIHGVHVVAYTKQVADVASDEVLDSSMKGVEDLIESNKVKALDIEASSAMEDAIKKAKREGDSVGGVVECVALDVPPGLGEPVFAKLTADLAASVASIPGVKGVEFGAGFKSARMRGTEYNDEFYMDSSRVRTRTNNAGGLNGGLSNGMPLVLRAALRPTASISKRQRTVDLSEAKDSYVKIEGRHDPCIVPRAVPVVEAMVNLVLADHMLLSQKIKRNL